MRLPLFPFLFLFFLFLLFSVKTKRNWILNQINSDYESCSEFHLFHVWFVVSSSFVSFSCSFLSPSVFQFSFLFYVPLSFPFLIVKVFQFSDNLSDNLAITFCWKRDPGGGIDSFDPKKKKGSTKKWTGSRHQATTLYSDLGSLMHFFIATNASFLEPLVYIKYGLSSSEMRS